MKTLRTIFLAIFTLVFVQTAFSQQNFVGKVVEVVNGKTAIIEIDPQKRITAEMEYIEIPEPDQQLHQTVKEHLQNLLLGKRVHFFAKTLMPTRLIGKIFLENVDVSQQLLRDGAAWYAIPDKKYQDPAESEIYQIIEAQAKLEKRGVWGIVDLKPAWEFRAEQAKKKEEAYLQSIYAPDTTNYTKKTTKRQPVANQKINPKAELWSNVSGTESTKLSEAKGLYSGYNSAANLGYTFTDGAIFNVISGKQTQKVESKIFYLYQGMQPGGTQVGFVMAFLSESPNYRFETSNNLMLVADGKKYALGKAVRFNRADGSRTQELLAYKIERATLEKLVKAKQIKFTVGSFSGAMTSEYRNLISNLLKNAL